MPGINVIDADGDVQEFADATTWHVDDRGQLHLKNAEKPVATFAKDRWQGVGTSEASSLSLAAHTVALQAHTEQLAEIHAQLRDILSPEKAHDLAVSIGEEVNRAIGGAR